MSHHQTTNKATEKLVYHKLLSTVLKRVHNNYPSFRSFVTVEPALDVIVSEPENYHVPITIKCKNQLIVQYDIATCKLQLFEGLRISDLDVSHSYLTDLLVEEVIRISMKVLSTKK